MKSIKILKENNPNENALVSLRNLCALLNIGVSKNAFQDIRSHSDYPSLISLIDFLENLSISTLSVSLQVSQLQEIPYPAIAHLKNKNGCFVVLKGVSDKAISYIDTQLGLINEPIEEFEAKWSGITLLVEANERSGEEGYKEKCKHERFLLWSNRIAWFLFCSLLTTPLFFISATIASCSDA